MNDVMLEKPDEIEQDEAYEKAMGNYRGIYTTDEEFVSNFKKNLKNFDIKGFIERLMGKDEQDAKM